MLFPYSRLLYSSKEEWWQIAWTQLLSKALSQTVTGATERPILVKSWSKIKPSWITRYMKPNKWQLWIAWMVISNWNRNAIRSKIILSEHFCKCKHHISYLRDNTKTLIAYIYLYTLHVIITVFMCILHITIYLLCARLWNFYWGIVSSKDAFYRTVYSKVTAMSGLSPTHPIKLNYLILLLWWIDLHKIKSTHNTCKCVFSLIIFFHALGEYILHIAPSLSEHFYSIHTCNLYCTW